MELRKVGRWGNKKPRAGNTTACSPSPQAQITSTETPSPCLLTQLPLILIRFSWLNSRSYFSYHNFNLILLISIFLLILLLALVILEYPSTQIYIRPMGPILWEALTGVQRKENSSEWEHRVLCPSTAQRMEKSARV